MKKLFLALVALSASLVSEAQIVSSTSKTITSHTTAHTVVVNEGYENYNRLSVNFASLKYSAEGETSDACAGFELAWDHGYNLTKGKTLPLYLEFGIHAQYNNHGDEDRYDDETYHHLDISIPLSITYKYNINDFYVAPFAGIHFKCPCLDDVAYDFGDESHSYFQMGYQVGGNLGYKNLNFQIGYKGDFTNLAKNEHYDISLKTGTFFVGLGYNF